MISIRRATQSDNIQAICSQIQPSLWGKDNEMSSYKFKDLKKYLEDDRNILLLAYDNDRIIGIALCYILLHPAGEHSLYVHELDTHPDYRRQGVSTLLMKKLSKLTEEKDLAELWVGTETTNSTADAFYRKLKPYEIEPSYIYSYKKIR